MASHDKPDTLVVLPGFLGWMALIGSGEVLKQFTFAHNSPDAAVRALDTRLLENAPSGTWNATLLCRLTDYATGVPVDFRDVRIDPGRMTDFQLEVVRCCREIPYGKTITYGQLATAAGFSGAARAVGNCMAANRIPLIVPCHRVVSADGRPGDYSAPGGSRTKQRLLELEAGRGCC